eukprot:5292512-Pleurochrysis_carterae.AAC.1
MTYVHIAKHIMLAAHATTALTNDVDVTLLGSWTRCSFTIAGVAILKSAPPGYKLLTHQQLAGDCIKCARTIILSPTQREGRPSSRSRATPAHGANLHKQTVMVPDWEDVERNHPANMLIGSAKGMSFQGTKRRLRGDHEDAKAVTDINIASMKSTGALNVVQLYTNNCSLMRAAWRLVV